MVVNNSKLVAVPLVIASGAAVSEAMPLMGKSAVGVQMPGTWTAADLGIEVSQDNTTWVPVAAATGGGPLLLDALASIYIAIDPNLTRGAKFVRFTSKDTSDGTAENQAAARTLIVSRRLAA